ncbi:hydroxyacyl-coenzyme A dehydrogenase, mitochondrial-like, partial [Leguminivora glycinivorella]|uniref:hydroxyacyl-coenzyme A dehydrogenase, mitochondrial-like n=1 Tax=Leguminivora glycinivorella TaxID=1035111 RepID=UPI00200FFC7A
ITASFYSALKCVPQSICRCSGVFTTGDATREDIDLGMKLGCGYPMGPLELADYTGLDTKKAILTVMAEATGDPVFRPIPLLDRLVEEGKFGRKSGEGIYKYDK